MYEQCDMEMFKLELNLPSSATYETIISTLYSCDSKKRLAIIKKASSETKANFKILSDMIKKHFVAS